MEADPHRKYLAVGYAIPDDIFWRLESQERDLLKRFQPWLEALAQGQIKPTTIRQAEFVAVARGHRPAKTKYEVLWIRFVEAKKAAIADELDILERKKRMVPDSGGGSMSYGRGMGSALTGVPSERGMEDTGPILGAELDRTDPLLANVVPKRVTCTACEGDGGPNGGCYKCFGTGWQS